MSDTTTSSAEGAIAVGDRLIRRSTVAVVVLVAVAAAYASYRHAYELIHAHGEAGAVAVASPFTVDGLIYASGMVLLQAARYGQRPPLLAYGGLWLGIAATIGANVAHGSGHGWIGALASAWPAVALIFSYELLMRVVRTGATPGAEAESAHVCATDDGCPHGVAATALDAALDAYFHARDCVGEPLTQRQITASFAIDRKKLGGLIKAAERARNVTAQQDAEEVPPAPVEPVEAPA